MVKEIIMPSTRGRRRQKVHGGGISYVKNKRNKGFSLVELVTIIAIMAVLLTVLTPSLLRYTEDSRAQKDVSTAGEIVNAFRLALADQKCFDEMLEYSCTNNYITYTDSSGIYGQIITDGEYWAPDGSGRATTITFNPTTSGSSIVYRMDNAIVNDMTYGNGSIGSNRQMEGNRINDIQCYFKNASLNAQRTGYTYNEVRQSIGDFVDITSQTYSNSSFTVFIKFSQKDNTTVAEVEGLFNGTNLYTGAESSNGSGTHDYSTDSNGNKKPNSTVDGGTSKPKYTNSDLAASGSLNGYTNNATNVENELKDYQEPIYIEMLQKEHKFEYYSSAALAATDITNGTYGENADCDKKDAVAGIFVQDNIPTLVILKDNLETKRIVLKKYTNVILGGHTLTFDTTQNNANVGMDLYNGGTVDGRIAGSAIVMTNIRHTIGYCMQICGDVTVNGGTYIHDYCVGGGAILTGRRPETTDNARQVYIKNITAQVTLHYSATLTASEKNASNIISLNSGGFDESGFSITIDNCTITGKSLGNSQNLSGVNWFGGKCVINDTYVEVEAEEIVEGTGGALGIRAQRKAIAECNNCTIISNHWAFNQQSEGKIILNNTEYIGKSNIPK
ncbi:MAG: type II secretion system protein [Agathobacter sp.]|nr:type II secretion system protein [Agathobacter sp.]